MQTNLSQPPSPANAPTWQPLPRWQSLHACLSVGLLALCACRGGSLIGTSDTTPEAASAAASTPAASVASSTSSASPAPSATAPTVAVARAVPVSDEGALTAIASDLANMPATSRATARYFTFEAYGNDPAANSAVPVAIVQSSLIKMVNMVSTGSKIVQPMPLASDAFIVRVDMRDLNWTVAAWQNLKATDTYFLPEHFPTTLAQAASQTMRADWFVFNLPNSAVDAYFQFLGINSADPNIDAANGVDRFADMAKGAPATVRGGQAVSGTEAHNRILSWHASSRLGAGVAGSGHLFKSYNFDTDTGTANIFSHPYRPTTNLVGTPGAYDFTFADSDNIFTLPNGLMGYYTTIGEAGGQAMNTNNAGAGFPGPQFCLQCHDNNVNLIGIGDQMNAALASANIPAATKTLLQGMYDVAAINKHAQEAGAQYQEAYQSLNLPGTDGVGERVEVTNRVADNYSVVLSVAQAAAEQGTTATKLVQGLTGTATAAQLASLLSVDAAGAPAGVVRRDLWEENYAAVRKALFPALPALRAKVAGSQASSRLATPVAVRHGCLAAPEAAAP